MLFVVDNWLTGIYNGECVFLFLGCGSCAPLDNGVPECAVDFMVLLGKVCVFRLQRLLWV